MTDDLTGDLDLLGDWLDAKGYGEEAGLCTRVMDHMHKQDARIAELETTHRENEVYRVAAADAVESMRARIAALEAEVSDLNECLTLAHMDGFEKGRDAARAAMEGEDD